MTLLNVSHTSCSHLETDQRFGHTMPSGGSQKKTEHSTYGF